MTDYGSDVSCVSDIASDGRTVSGFVVVGEAIARRLSTPRGRLIADPNYGFDLTQFINEDMSPRDIAGLQSGVVAECLKDERVSAADATATLDRSGVLTLSVNLELSTESFTLVLAVSAVKVEIIRVDP